MARPKRGYLTSDLTSVKDDSILHVIAVSTVFSLTVPVDG